MKTTRVVRSFGASLVDSTALQSWKSNTLGQCIRKLCVRTSSLVVLSLASLTALLLRVTTILNPHNCLKLGQFVQQVPASIHQFNMHLLQLSIVLHPAEFARPWHVLLTCNKHQLYKARGNDCELIEHTRDLEDNMMHLPSNTCLLSFGPSITCSAIYSQNTQMNKNKTCSSHFSLT